VKFLVEPHVADTITNHSRGCSINRYYDPTTDQFLSIDPDVAMTNQPYVFTNDDPLNSEDPNGLHCFSFVCLYNDLAVNVEAASAAAAIVSVTAASVVVDDTSGGLDADAAIVKLFNEQTGGANGSTGEDIPGLSSKYEDVTTKGSIRNVSTDVTPSEFGDNLKSSGWKETTSQDGRATNYTKDGAKYSVYSSSTGRPTAEFFPQGSPDFTLKIRLGR
jgi:hypothetical protein